MPRIADRSLLQDGGGLRILAGCPQRLGVGDRELWIGRVRAITLAERIGALSKSMTAEETGLNDALTAAGIEPVTSARFAAQPPSAAASTAAIASEEGLRNFDLSARR